MSSSSRTIKPADRLYLSPSADAARLALRPPVRHAVNQALREIKADPDWLPGSRHIAPAGSRHAGAIVDISVVGVAIVYQVRVKERAVEVIDINQIFAA